jgi:hypothetical protein
MQRDMPDAVYRFTFFDVDKPAAIDDDDIIFAESDYFAVPHAGRIYQQVQQIVFLSSQSLLKMPFSFSNS